MAHEVGGPKVKLKELTVLSQNASCQASFEHVWWSYRDPNKLDHVIHSGDFTGKAMLAVGQTAQ